MFLNNPGYTALATWVALNCGVLIVLTLINPRKDRLEIELSLLPVHLITALPIVCFALLDRFVEIDFKIRLRR